MGTLARPGLDCWQGLLKTPFSAKSAYICGAVGTRRVLHELLWSVAEQLIGMHRRRKFGGTHHTSPEKRIMGIKRVKKTTHTPVKKTAKKRVKKTTLKKTEN